jgi:putative transposase
MDGLMPDYPTDLTDAEWEAARRFIQAGKPIGVDRTTSMRTVVNAIFYRHRSGCSWRMLPHDFPHWRTVYGYFRQWKLDGTWRNITAARRRARSEIERPQQPLAKGR